MPKVYGRKTTAIPSTPLWPRWINRIFEGFREIPWISFAAIGSGLGVLILFFYFLSIDHFPGDFSSVVALGAVTAAYSIGLLITGALCFAAPAIIYRDYMTVEGGMPSPPSKVFTTTILILLQLGGAGFLFCLLLLGNYQKCRPNLAFLHWIGWPLLFVGLGALVSVFLNKKDGKSGGARAVTGLSVGVLGSTPLLAIIPLLPLFHMTWWSGIAVIFVVWIFVIWANATLANKLPGIAIALASLVFIGWAYLALPFVVMQPHFFPNLVARHVGVRGEGEQMFYMPQGTCNLVRVAVSSVGGNASVNCSSVDWNAVSALMLSNVGDRWLIEVDAGVVPDPSDQKIRITVPGRDVQMRNNTFKRTFQRNMSLCEK
jgi:hypothetical protein